jgi:V/A-type H+-transporting ATPase subunit E
LASNQLPWLREHSGKGLFSTLAAELPSVRWSVVRIHKDDIDLARAAFPEAQVEGDSGITSGLIAQSEDGSMQVINTLEKRLERAWPQLLPELFRLVRKEWENAS